MSIALRTLSILALLMATALPARAQLPGTEELLKTPKITLGKGSTTLEKVLEIQSQLEQREKALLKEQANLLRWREEADVSTERVKELEALRRATRERLARDGEAAVDPALLPQLDASLDLENDLSDTLEFIIETFRLEQHEVTEGIQHAKRLADQLQSPPPSTDGKRYSLDEVLQYLSDLRLSQISLSLLKARRAGLNEELSQSFKERKREFKLEPLGPSEQDPQGREVTLRLREEQTQRYPLLVSYRKDSRTWVAAHIEAQLQRVRLQIYDREESLLALEARREQVFGALAVTQEALDGAGERLRAADERIIEDERKVRRRLKKLRHNPPAEDETGQFSTYRDWQMEVTVLQHRLYLLDIERQVETFRTAAVFSLHNLLQGQPAPPEFREKYAWYLDADRQLKARAELNTRRDAWRQEYARLSTSEPPPGKETLANTILERYQELLDLYDQVDSGKWQIEWCAELVRHYQARLEVAQRDAWWYIWRWAATLAAFVLAVLLSVVLGRWTLRPLKSLKSPPGWLRYLLFLTYIGGVFLAFTGLAVVTLTHVWGSLFGFERIGELFTMVLFTIGDKEITLLAFAGLLGVIAVTIGVNRVVVRFVRNHIFAYFTWDLGVQDAVAAVVKYLVLFAGIVLGLEFVGIGLGALALFAGVIGIGIGFGLQAIANNFISGFTLLFERPIKKGDFVDAGGLEGRVHQIRARATTVVTRDKVSVIIPNSEFVSGRVVNWSHGSENVRLHIPVGVAYGSDVQLVSRLLVEVGQEHHRVLKRPAPEVWFMGFGDSSLNFELLVWTRDVEMKYHTTSDLNFAIDRAFRENNVTIPFPQRDLHIRSDDTRNPPAKS